VQHYKKRDGDLQAMHEKMISEMESLKEENEQLGQETSSSRN
jgi:hypothetical protein